VQTPGAPSAGHKSSAAPAGPQATGPSAARQAFNALEPALFDACGSCHGVPGGLPGEPKWLLGPDRYETITKYPGIVVTDASTSLLLEIGDTLQHAGGPGLSDSPPTHLRDKVTTWLELEAESIAAIPLPATAPFALHAGQNTVDLSQGGVKGASMAFTAQIEGTIITFTDIVVSAPPSTGFEIADPIFAIVRPGKAAVGDIGDSFSNLDETVPAGQTLPLGVGLLILDVDATIGQDWSDKDELEIQFTTLAAVAAGSDGGTGEGGVGGCKDVAAFTADAVPAIEANTCLTCHQGENVAATANLDLTELGTNNAAACAQALTRVNVKDPAKSPIILAPTGGIPGHPFTGASASFKTMMLEWIDKE
jgi:hypothetical protein